MAQFLVTIYLFIAFATSQQCTTDTDCIDPTNENSITPQCVDNTFDGNTVKSCGCRDDTLCKDPTPKCAAVTVFGLTMSMCNATATATVTCFERGKCKARYMDKTEGNGYDHSKCGVDCDGKEDYTDTYCNCACVIAPESCDAFNDNGYLAKKSTNTIVIIIAASIGFCVLCICLRCICVSQRTHSRLPTQTQPTAQRVDLPMQPMHQVPMQPMHQVPMQQVNIVPQQQPQVIFVIAEQMQQQMVMTPPQSVIYATGNDHAVTVPLQTQEMEPSAPPRYEEVDAGNGEGTEGQQTNY